MDNPLGTQLAPLSGARRPPSLLRGLGVGLVGATALCLAEILGIARLSAASLASDYSTGWAVFGTFVLVALVNPLLKRLLPRLALSGGEIVMAYSVMIAACPVISGGFVLSLIPKLAAVRYMASPANHWQDLILPYVPDWMALRSDSAARWFYEGLPVGHTVPWTLWVEPLTYWFVPMCVVFFVMVCTVLMLRRQWVDSERLIFPLTALPLELAQDTTAAFPAFLRNHVMWAGFALPFIFNSLRALHSYVPPIPAMNIVLLLAPPGGKFLMQFALFWDVVGLSFLLTTDVSLSLWSMCLLYTFVQYGFNRVGFKIGELDYIHTWGMEVGSLSVGAMLGLVGTVLWRARSSLKQVFVAGLSGQRGEEPVSYRTLVWGSLIGLGVTLWWLTYAGLPLGPAPVYLLFVFVMLLGLTRIVAQAGQAYLQEPALPQALTVSVLGSRALGPHGLVPLAFHLSWTGEMRTMFMAAAANAMKAADAKRLSGKALLACLAGGVLTALVVGSVAGLWLGYKEGAINLGYLYAQHPRWQIAWAERLLNAPRAVEWGKLAFWALGAGLFLAVNSVHSRFLWWPVHPLGLAVGITYTLVNAWLSVLIAWLLKVVILRYFGPRTYERAVPFFLGLVLGHFASAGLWQIIAICTRVPLPRFGV